MERQPPRILPPHRPAVKSIDLDIVEAIKKIATIGFGYFNFSYAVERGKKHTVVAGDDSHITHINNEMLVGAHKVRSISEDCLGSGLSFQYYSLEIGENTFPNLTLRKIAEIDNFRRIHNYL